MTTDEVLAYLEECRLLISLQSDTYLRLMGVSAFDACEAAVKKQIPQKPVKFTVDDVIAYKCDCGEIVGQADYFCPFCGQAIDWEDTDKNSF